MAHDAQVSPALILIRAVAQGNHLRPTGTQLDIHLNERRSKNK